MQCMPAIQPVQNPAMRPIVQPPITADEQKAATASEEAPVVPTETPVPETKPEPAEDAPMTEARRQQLREEILGSKINED